MTAVSALQSKPIKSSTIAITATSPDVWEILEERGISREFAVNLGLRVSKGEKRGRILLRTK